MAPELGMGAFMAAIKGTLMGRDTWDMVEAMMGGRGGGSAGDRRNAPPFPTKGSVSIASGSAADIAAAARARGPGPYWLMGGGDLAAQLLAAGELDRIDLFTIPVLLGSGIPAFRNDRLLALELASSGTYPKGHHASHLPAAAQSLAVVRSIPWASRWASSACPTSASRRCSTR